MRRGMSGAYVDPEGMIISLAGAYAGIVSPASSAAIVRYLKSEHENDRS